MADNGLPCLDLLEATPGILSGLMSELTDHDTRWKPAPDRFSVAEVLAHLWKLVAVHQEAGEITLNQMLHEWALHDLGHIRQIAELSEGRV